MQHRTALLISVLLLLLLLVAWLYLLFFGKPSSVDEIFNNFNLGGGEDGGIVIPPPVVVEEPPVVEVVRPRLRQLTTKPVIGFVPLASTTPTLVRFAEAGTGHIYDVDTDSGTETRVANYTVAEASRASFSPSGEYVAIKAHNDKRAGPLAIGTLSSGSEPSWFTLEKTIYDFALLASKELIYTERTVNGVTATAYDVGTGTSRTVFTVPFFEITHVWGTSSKAEHFVYNRPAHALESYLYSFQGGVMSRVNASGFGFTALPYEDSIVTTNRRDSRPFSTVYDRATKLSAESPVVLLPEKCVRSARLTDTLWCGADAAASFPYEFPDAWYRGDLSFDDDLYSVSLIDGGATTLVDILGTAGREIDVVSLTNGHNESALYFINKNDSTLWLYEL